MDAKFAQLKNRIQNARTILKSTDLGEYLKDGKVFYAESKLPIDTTAITLKTFERRVLFAENQVERLAKYRRTANRIA